ncbi:MAG: hypothetical protein WBO84_12770 [Acidimicrobiia bacterium]|jgi:hypothetical protein
MGQRAERIFRINDEIAALRRDEYLAFEELVMLGHLDDDARRNAAVSGSLIDAADARESAGDVARMERHVRALRAARERLEHQRDQMLDKLSVSVVE